MKSRDTLIRLKKFQVDERRRKVVQIEFKPDWTRHAKAAPFKRNDALLDAMPVGIVIFPGSGITENLADKARRLGIPVWKFGAGRP